MQEQEPTIPQNDKEISLLYDKVISKSGLYESEAVFKEAVSTNPKEASLVYEKLVKPTGLYADESVFTGLFNTNKQSEKPTAQPPVYKPDNTKRFTNEEASVLIDKYFPGIGVAPSARETAIKQMEGKTEAELVRMFPQVGKRLAEVQKKSAAPGTTTSPSSGAQSVLPSLVERAETEKAFANYEQLQSQTVELQKRQEQLAATEIGRFGTKGIEQEKAAIRKQNESQFRASKLESDKARNEAFDKIKPMLEKDFSDEKNLERLIRTNESGVKVPDPYFIDDYAKQKAREYGQPEDGFFKELIYNEATKIASFKAIQPEVEAKYNARKEGIVKKYQARLGQDFDKNFTTDEIEQKKLDAQIVQLKDRVTSEYKVEENKLIEGLKAASSQYDADYTAATTLLNQQADEIKKLAESGQMPMNEAQARMASIKQEFEQIESTYVAAKDESFNTYLSSANQLSRKYNTRLKRQAEELADVAQRAVEKAKNEFLEKSGVNAEMQKELELAYNMAYNEVIKEKEAQIQGKQEAAYRMFGALSIPVTFAESFKVALGGELKAYGTAFDNNWLQRYGDYLSTNYSLPEVKTEEFSDLFNIQNLTQLSGQLAGSALIPVLASAATSGAGASLGASALVRGASTALASWSSGALSNSARVYDDTFRQTGDAALASQRAEKMWDAQVSTMYLSGLDWLPFVGSSISRLPFIERILLGAAAEVGTETMEELRDNIAEKNIMAGKEAFDDALNMIQDDWKSTMITVAPVAAFGAAGQIKRESSTQEKLDAMAKGYAQKVAASDLLNKGNAATDTWVSRMVASSGGLNFATTTINTLFANGTITEEQKVQMEESALQANQNIQNAKAAGLSTSNAIVYDAMARKVNSLNAELTAAKESGDVANQKLITANLNTANQLLDTFAKTKAGNFATVQFADGSYVVMTDLSFMEEPDAAEKLKGARIQVYSEDGAQLLTEYMAKAADAALSENPLTPNTNESVQQNNQDVGQGGQANDQGENQGSDGAEVRQEDGRQERLLTEQPAQEGETSSAAGVDLDAQIKVAKEKLAEAKRKAAAMRRSPGIAPNPEEQGFRDREVIDAYIEIGKLYFKKGVRSVEDFARELGETVSDAMKQAWDAIVSENGSFDMGGPPAIIPPIDAPNMGGRPTGQPGRVRAVYERVAKKMEERGEPQVQIDMVREKGTYQPQSRQETWDFAAALIEEMGGNYDAALMVASSIDTGEFNYEIVKAILAIQHNKLWEKAKSGEGLTIEEVNKYAQRFDQIAKASTSEGRSMDLNKDIYHTNPDLFYYDRVERKIAEENNSKVASEDKAATRKTAQKAQKVRTDAFSLMSEVLAGRVSLEALYTPDNKYYLSDAKLRNLLSVLVTFGQSLDGIDPEAKNILKAIFQQTEAFGNDVPLSKVRELIAANLNDLNGRVPVPFPIEQLQQVEEAMMNLFMEMLSVEWNKTFDGRSAEQPFVSKRDIFNQLANVVSGKSDAVILFSFGDLTQRMSRGLSKLLSVLGTEAGPVSDVAFVPLRALLRSGQFANMANPRSNEFVPTKGRNKVQAAVEAIQRNNATQAILDFLSDKRVNGVTSGPQFKEVLDEYIASLDESSRKAIEDGMLWLYNDFVVKNPGYKPGNKSGLAQILDRIRESGIFAKLETREEVENIIRTELANLNPSLQTPMGTDEIQEVAKSFLDIYEEIADKKLTDLLQREMPKRYTKALQVQLPKVVKSIMYGVLDMDENNPAKSDVVMNKFAPYFGGINPNNFTEDQKATLRQMSQNVVAAAKFGGFNYQVALQSFNRTLNNIIAQNSPLSKSIPLRLQNLGIYFSAYVFENILFSVNTLLRTLYGNVSRVVSKTLGGLMRGDIDMIKDAWSRSIETQPKVDVQLVDGAGNNVFTEVILNRTVDTMYSAVRGNPKLAEAKQKGLSNIELEIRMMDSRWKRNLARATFALSQRAMTAIDSATTPLAVQTTKAQIFYEYIKNAYEAAGLPYTRYEITQQVNEILQPGPDEFSKALVKAYEETIQTELFKNSGVPFPFVRPSQQAFLTMSVEAKIYNEWLVRAYEVIDNQEAQRAQAIAFNSGYLGALDILNDVKKIDEYTARVVSEMTYLGTPRGSFGPIATYLTNLSSKAKLAKYTGLLPMFINAGFNAMAFFVKITPVLNVIQYGKYAARKRRGNWWFLAAGENIDVNAIRKVDMREMGSMVASTNILAIGVLSAMSILRGDDDDERRKIFSGKGTFITPVRLPEWMRGLGYEPGGVYIDGTLVHNYRDGAFSGFFGALAYMDNYSIGINPSTAMQAKPLLSDDREFTEAIQGYAMYILATVADNSMMRPTVDMAHEIFDAVNADMFAEGGGNKASNVGKVLMRNLASLLKNLVPKGRFMGELKNIADAAMEEPEKTTTLNDGFRFIATGTAFEDWVDLSNKTDWFGRDKVEELRLAIPKFFFEKAKPQDEKTLLFLEMNYVPRSIPAEKMPIEVSESTLGSKDNFDDAVKRYQALAKNEDFDRDITIDEEGIRSRGQLGESLRTTVMMPLTAKETYDVHRDKGFYVGKILDSESNIQNARKLERENFESAMNELYNIGRYYAVIMGAASSGDQFKGMFDQQGLDVLKKQYVSKVDAFNTKYQGFLIINQTTRNMLDKAVVRN